MCIIVMGFWGQAQAKQEYLEVNWDSLDLSDSQRNNLKNLDNRWKSTVSDIVPRIQTNERKLKQLMQSSKPNEGEILKLQQQIHEDKTQLKMEATEIFLHKRKVLNNQQQEKLQKMINLH